MSVDLDAIEARWAAATSGPWRYNPGKEWFTDPDKLRAARAGVRQSGGEEYVAAGPAGMPIGVAATGPTDDSQAMADAEAIAHAPSDVAALIAEVRRLREILERVARANDLVETSADEIIAVYDGEP